jgi:arylsulfatase A-like enzyme
MMHLLLLTISSSAATPTRPHIFFHVVDDLGWNDLGYQRGALPGQHNAIESPHIDTLALAGIRLHDYAVFKFCSPSRSQFLVGRYALARAVLNYHRCYTESPSHAY